MGRRDFRSTTGWILTCLAWAMTASSCTAPGSAPVASPSAAPRLPVYVGTYTGGESRGIYRFELDAHAGTWSAPTLAGECANPSFLALHPSGRVLYAVNELATFGGASTGAVSAFAIDPRTGALALLAQQASGGADPCHLVVDRGGRCVLVANYSSGSIAVLPLDADSSLQPASTVRRHVGSGPDRSRQTGPHAHAVVLDSAERFALAADLGVDRIFVYRFDAARGRLEPNEPNAVALAPGSGPRHFAWHPSGDYLYAINELRSTLTAFRYDPRRGALEAFQTITTLPVGFSGQNTAAELALSPDGRFLYASNRGDDSLALFRIDAAAGTLAAAGHVATGGRTPRHFALDPSGRWLLVANQASDSIAVFRLDPQTGRPAPVGRPLAIPDPACVLFAAQAR